MIDVWQDRKHVSVALYKKMKFPIKVFFGKSDQRFASGCEDYRTGTR